MTETARILIIEDNLEMVEVAKREISDFFTVHTEIDVEVEVETDFDRGLARVRDGASDVVVLDVRRDATATSDEDATAGHIVYREFKEARFAPVVFWTALPDTVRDEQMIPLVTVVAKDDTVNLPTAIESAINSHAVSTIAGIEDHVATVLRKHMWNELAPNWPEYTQGAETADIAPVLLSRLARVLEDDREGELTTRPSHRYVYPPTSEVRAPGDILHARDNTWWVTLTPACDFAQNKVEFVLLGRAKALSDHAKYQGWSSANTGTSSERNKWNSLRQDVLMATSGRFHYLPAFRNIPDLVIDLEFVQSIALDEMESHDRLASLASPFAESLLVQYSHYRGRIGVPDLDSEQIKNRLLTGRQELAGQQDEG